MRKAEKNIERVSEIYFEILKTVYNDNTLTLRKLEAIISKKFNIGYYMAKWYIRNVQLNNEITDVGYYFIRLTEQGAKALGIDYKQYIANINQKAIKEATGKKDIVKPLE